MQYSRKAINCVRSWTDLQTWKMVKKKNAFRLKASNEFLDRYEHTSWIRENEVGNTVWVPAIKPISLSWKPPGSDIRLNYVNALAVLLKSFSTVCQTLTPEITSVMKCSKPSLVCEFWMCQAMLSLSLGQAHGSWPAGCINWRED